jgi:hypothetical protein
MERGVVYANGYWRKTTALTLKITNGREIKDIINPVRRE